MAASAKSISPWDWFQIVAEIFAGTKLVENVEFIDSRGAWESFAVQANNQAVLHAVAQRLSENKTVYSALAEQQRAMLKQALVSSVKRNLAISRTALKVSRILNSAGITPVWFKGTAGLLTDLYPSIAYRRQEDVDLVVSEAEQLPAIEVLRGEGYEFSAYETVGNQYLLHEIVGADARARALEKYRHHHHFPPMLRSSEGVSVELHRHPLPRRWQKRLSLDEFYSYLLPQERNGARFLTPNPELGIAMAILGRFASDGLAATYEFPLPQAGDCLCQMKAAAIRSHALDSDWIHDKCGDYFPLFIGLLGSLFGQDTAPLLPDVRAPARYLKLMELKQNYPVTRKLIDAQGRFRRVCSTLADDPAKIRRRITV